MNLSKYSVLILPGAGVEADQPNQLIHRDAQIRLADVTGTDRTRAFSVHM